MRTKYLIALAELLESGKIPDGSFNMNSFRTCALAHGISFGILPELYLDEASLFDYEIRITIYNKRTCERSLAAIASQFGITPHAAHSLFYSFGNPTQIQVAHAIRNYISISGDQPHE